VEVRDLLIGNLDPLPAPIHPECYFTRVRWGAEAAAALGSSMESGPFSYSANASSYIIKGLACMRGVRIPGT
jgi:hypothetical protein